MPDFSIDNIVGHIRNVGLLQPNRYEVIINGLFNVPRPVVFNCRRCQIPSQSLGSFDQSVIGPIRKIPNLEIYDDLSTTFYVSETLEEVSIFHNWIKHVGGGSTYRMAYYNDIVADIKINIYNRANDRLGIVNIYEAYPIGITEVELAYDGITPAEVTVNWAYHNFSLENDQFRAI